MILPFAVSSDPQFYTELGKNYDLVLPRIRGRLIFARAAGSRGFNCNREGSDWDFAGVWVGDPAALLGLNPPHPTVASPKGVEPNYCYYEARHYLKMLLSGNPAALEMLYADDLYNYLPEWDGLRAVRDRFVTQQAVDVYLHFLKGQWRRYGEGRSVGTTGGKPNEKWKYHVIRLLMAARQMAEGGPPLVWATGPAQDTLMSIRSNELEFDGLAAELMAAVEARRPFPLPPEPDRAAAERWLLGLYGLVKE